MLSSCSTRRRPAMVFALQLVIAPLRSNFKKEIPGFEKTEFRYLLSIDTITILIFIYCTSASINFGNKPPLLFGKTTAAFHPIFLFFAGLISLYSALPFVLYPSWPLPSVTADRPHSDRPEVFVNSHGSSVHIQSLRPAPRCRQMATILSLAYYRLKSCIMSYSG